jgi:thioredoxin
MKRNQKKITAISLSLIAVLAVITFTVSSFKLVQTSSTGVKVMNKQMYLDKIYDFIKSPSTFKYKGTRPAVIDFYANWCRPCKMVAPIMEELAIKYEGKVDFYKVNVDNEKDLASLHAVQSIPLIVFFPLKGEPTSSMGALNKEDYITLIDELLNKK